ncbi:hypothetical protein BT96DRAFT_957907 [Gymnopus androsaceus JB14]|uniref:Uncharacterized protein n=1 Tax=Gymnopus androsaceus JB14 TaxID=1447944 RepID=A0A6A4HKP1_9AGAR|nr:hypothetical protein BT96DRAFT_957907 [Gymnopus androsaceus JB14]
MLFSSIALLAWSLCATVVVGQDGSVTGPTSSAQAAGYSCDPSKCQLPNCNCASTSPPAPTSSIILLLNPITASLAHEFHALQSSVPQFYRLHRPDDAVQSYTLDAVNQFLAQRKNPNGCPIKMTYYTSLNYTNYTLVTDWFVAGNEIADHTMTHVGTPPQDEIDGNLVVLNALAGTEIIGFRAPYLNYSVQTLQFLQQAGFTYDSSATSSLPVDAEGTDAYWPYTLDYGLANDCLSVEGICQGQPQIPGFLGGVEGIHLMDPWLDTANGNSVVNDSATLEYMQNTFTAHYNGNRQPIGLYTHPYSSCCVPAPTSTINMINQFLDWAQEQPDVWIVSTQQLLEWVRNPEPIANLDNSAALKCSTPQVDSSTKICNGIPQNEAGLLDHCAFADFPFYTCYGCPVETPTPGNPNPAQSVPSGGQARFRLPANCSTPFWDPIQGSCLCQESSCEFNDVSRPIGPNGANLTGGGTGGALESGSASPSPSYAPFNGADGSLLFAAGTRHALIFGLVGVVLGAVGVLVRV